MPGQDRTTSSLFSYADLENRVPDQHPLRLIREIVNQILAALSPEFEQLYSHARQASIPPEKPFRAVLL